MYIPINYISGKWVIQKTIYNLLLDKVVNIQSNSFIAPTTSHAPNKHFCLIDKVTQRIVFIDLITKRNEIYFSNIFAFNTYNQSFTKRYCYISFNKTLFIQLRCFNISVVEKFWVISQNLVLSISIIQYKRDIISVIFESKIRI